MCQSGVTYVEPAEVRGCENAVDSHCTGCYRVRRLVSHFAGILHLDLCYELCRGYVKELPQRLPGPAATLKVGKWTCFRQDSPTNCKRTDDAPQLNV